MAQLSTQDYEEELARLHHIIITETNKTLTRSAAIKYFVVFRALTDCHRGLNGIKKPKAGISQIPQASKA